tara:strand:- start:106 stop:366 length:261 start_codon:yes stop_codon:yes gene_type:complete
MNSEEQLKLIIQITGNLDDDPVEAVKKLRKRYNKEYETNRDKAMNNGAEVVFARNTIKQLQQQLRQKSFSLKLLKKKLNLGLLPSN